MNDNGERKVIGGVIFLAVIRPFATILKLTFLRLKSDSHTNVIISRQLNFAVDKADSEVFDEFQMSLL